ncbi:efflux RND transporter periplasmic adaptor subunit [Pseudobutyrivibrio xylanivorans]|uniref:Efflux RND transporter periplasmic adaptor subunit n=1 Tax=Pseudobutyrivibrio xylanivorans TaxID=185007 RepID=A0A5P6VSJ0_PSEXY|nr:efflux RND transporter periplasmic adaptor subunit [Pseudobutyrivibrio xylanivorans]QFJ55420.1 efflux RND transporter periplasmic adaptor subunit [Pseudobutyrivibrio xylanivorans]
MKRKIVALILIAALAAGGFAAYKTNFFGFNTVTSSDSSEVYVMPLSDIMGSSSSYSTNVFMGIVEGQETTSVTKSSERELDKLLVSEGDVVTVGTPLFSYKSDSLEAENVQYGFDIETANININEYNRTIEKLTSDYAKIKGQSDEDKNNREDLANQIESLKTDIAIAENSISSTNAKIDENKKKIANSTVTSTVDGVITKIADDTNPYTSDGSFITILASKEMRVKGQINEQNVWAINIDEPVTLRSRVDKSKTWSGKITKIDTETKQESDSNSYDGSSEDNSTKYPFYVTLDNSDGLMMGQHLYIELGQTDAPEMDFSDGTYIYEYYISYDDDGNPFVWADKNGHLEKKSIELGEYYEEQMVYAISGIDKDTKIAYPMEDFTEGMGTVSGIEGE